MRLLRRLLVALLAVVATYLLAAVIGAVVPGKTTPQAESTKNVTIHLVRSPIHYDFLLPLDGRTTERLGWLRVQGTDLDHPYADFLVVGWGGRAFYTTVGDYSDVRPAAVWRGVTGDESVMRVSIAGSLQPDWPTVTLTLSHAQYEALLNAIEASFAQGPQTQALPIPGFSRVDRFFAATDRFHIFRTCNTWIGRMLREAGVEFGIWTPTPFAVSLSAKWFAS